MALNTALDLGLRLRHVSEDRGPKAVRELAYILHKLAACRVFGVKTEIIGNKLGYIVVFLIFPQNTAVVGSVLSYSAADRGSHAAFRAGRDKAIEMKIHIEYGCYTGA